MVDHLGATWQRWESSKGPLLVQIHWALVDGRAEAVGIEVWTTTPYREPNTFDGWLPKGHTPRPLTATMVDEVPVGRLVEGSRNTQAMIGEGHAPTSDPEQRRRLRRAAKAFGAPPRRGRPKLYDDAYYQSVADHYSRAFRGELDDEATGQFWSNRPTQAVAEKFSISKTTAAKHIAECRSPERKLLPPTGKGRASATAASKRRKS